MLFYKQYNKMLPKKNRITKSKDFDNVYKNGVAARAHHLLIKAVSNNKNKTRIGVIVGKKVSPKAVTRNKLKRRLRNIFYQKINNIKEGFDIIVIPSPRLKNEEFIKIKESVIKALQKINLI